MSFPMDLKKLKRLISIVESSAISELELTDGDSKVRIVKSTPQIHNQMVGVPSVMTSQDNIHTVNMASPHKISDQSVADIAEESSFIVRSPMVGTFYSSSAPNNPPFVSVGSVVSVGDVVCIIEAMKLLNEIETECSGVVVSIFVENGEPVEFNQPLFALR